jgi:chemotaxis protein MotB
MADGEEGVIEEPVKCPECDPGLPGWMATFSDLVTLLLTFFVLLLSFAKTESSKYEAALGSIRNAFGGNVFKQGEVIQRGKSPDDSPTMIESQQPIKPFPIEFLTMEGILDKREINRESEEELKTMKSDLKENSLANSAEIYEMPEGIKVRIKDKIYFKNGSVKIDKISIKIFEKMISLLKNKNWTVFVEGHASIGEVSKDGTRDAFVLSSLRAAAVTRALIRRGVRADKVTTVFYGDTRQDKISGEDYAQQAKVDRRVEFIIRKRDLRTGGHKVESI